MRTELRRRLYRGNLYIFAINDIDTIIYRNILKDMKYEKIVKAKFIDRPNRFIAHVDLNGAIETVHVKNTGRCRELLIPGANVVLEDCDNPARKTRYDLVAVEKAGLGWVNIDSQAANKVVKEWLEKQDYAYIKPEYKFGGSRIDFYMEREIKAESNNLSGEKSGMVERFLLEVKGCTLEINGVGYFPDAPTERGVKHLRELAAAVKDGYRCIVAFVIQMNGIDEVRPNIATHKEFGEAWQEAADAGVEFWFLTCHVQDDGFVINADKYWSAADK